MKKIKLLLMDACVVIHLHEIGVWQQVLSRCEVVVSETVLSEVLFYEVNEEKIYLDLSSAIASGDLQTIAVPASQVQAFKDQFLPGYQGELDAGEAECLAFLVTAKEEYLICSADGIVPKVLGCLRKEDQGFSVEELLQKCGLGRKVAHAYTKARFDDLVKRGQQDAFLGSAMKPNRPGNNP